MQVTNPSQTEQRLSKAACHKTIMAVKDAMYLLEGKWKIHILTVLCFHPMRYTDILREVEGISGKMLSRQLKEMELNKLVKRTVTSPQNTTVEYQLTEYGHSFKDVVKQLALWGQRHREHILAGDE